ncbi:BZ3500_MvSof-1268-A1-R1_Chr1-3g01722 [Microbotryum saponariae]|uniref:BZ3500_MvSof-1268-A1-R1_Chr1-3g01722 protein n=1 Tax=Microbotryum saponariae TaxID=289078 RepID=A0A2X0MJK9_9BASI|nr:BZ3500_MvSof-1268-A1-R1_Chr1-3g01722 [Microbotryum saponariae]SCZ94430.1 BZ3501_MvSof-1269-A2-R1_Chr1-3g01323 [Microbotryum saponariae]
MGLFTRHEDDHDHGLPTNLHASTGQQALATAAAADDDSAGLVSGATSHRVRAGSKRDLTSPAKVDVRGGDNEDEDDEDDEDEDEDDEDDEDEDEPDVEDLLWGAQVSSRVRCSCIGDGS